MSLGNYSSLFSYTSISGNREIEDTYGLNTQIQSYTHDFGGGATIVFRVLTYGCLKIMFVRFFGAYSGGDINVNLPSNVFSYDTNAISLVKTKSNFPVNQESGVVASGEIVPYTGAENSIDPLLTYTDTNYGNDSLPLQITSDNILSGNTEVIHTQNLFYPVADDDSQPTEYGENLQLGIYTSEYDDTTFDPETKDILVYDTETNEAQWAPEETLEPSEFDEKIAEATQITLPFGFECGALVLFFPINANKFPRLLYNTTTNRYDIFSFINNNVSEEKTCLIIGV
jgi:hypothetical protein